MANDSTESLPRAIARAKLGKYRMLAHLGRGGTADVYLAVSHGLGGFHKLRVIKILRESFADDPRVVEMFLEEARLAARLSHANIVQTYEVDEIDGHYFIDMEYVEGQSLESIAKRLSREGRRMPPRLAARIVADALAGLRYAHEFADYDGTPLDIVHRDISPHNVLLQYEGAVKLVDFGIAKVSDRATSTETGIIKGKVAYMAPEQVVSPHTVDRRVDIFAAGLVLHELLCGRRFWGEKGNTEILHSLFRSKIERVAEESIPSDLVPVVARALSANRDYRYSTALEMARDLERYLAASDAPAGKRELGEFVTALFDEDRRELRSRIDAQLKSLEAGTGSGSALIDVSARGSARQAAGDTSHSLVSGPPEEVAARRRSAIAATLMLVVSAVVFALVLVHRGIEPADLPSEAQPKAAAARPLASAPAPVASASEVRVRFATEPTEAKLFLDDAELPQNPYVAELARDRSTHRLRAEARGYVSRSVVVSLATDTDFVLQLEKAPDARDAAMAKPKPKPDPSHDAPKPVTVPTSSASLGAPRPSSRPLDETNPFK
jgi:serine/threonine-protein kinase